MEPIEQLEAAILDRAEQLAAQHRRQAQSGRERILHDANERLQLREQHEMLLAKTLAERSYRRKVQAEELKLQARLDQLRWALVSGVLDRLREQLRTLADDSKRYRPVLRALVLEASSELAQPELLIACRQADRALLEAELDGLGRAAGCRLRLDDNAIEGIGGVLLHSVDRRLRYDNRFEGRLHRLGDALHAAIIEHLLPAPVEQAAEG